MHVPGFFRGLLAVAALAALAVLYRGPLGTGFLNDDYLFLEAARTRTLVESLGAADPLGNYFRPISRQVYYEALAAWSRSPLAFHLVNFGLFLAALALLADLLRARLPLAGVLAGLLYFALLPLQRVNLTWVSCAQDLLALVFSLAAVAWFRRGRTLLAATAYLAAVFSKESALPLPAALAAWAWWMDRETPRAVARRLAPFAAVALAWTGVALAVERLRPRVSAPLHFDLEHFAAGYVHGIQSLLGIEDLAGFAPSLAGSRPDPAALVGLGALALLLWRSAGATAPTVDPVAAPDPAGARTPATRAAAGFGVVWFLALGLAAGPAASGWSSYYYTLVAVGAAWLVGLAARRLDSMGWLLLCGLLLWWNAAGASVRAFSVAERPWTWTSHLTSFYFQRAAALTDSLGHQLRRIEPAPASGTRFYFATLPPWAGFQMGNGAQVRALYGDPTLVSHFYSQFSESTAAGHPCHFLYWDGRALAPLYGPGVDRFFQVGSDLLVFGRFEGARHAFRRGLAAGEHPVDHLYWLGWTEWWLGRRPPAEAAWSRFGATDDSVLWWGRMRLARMALNDRRDTIEARRQLAEAIRAGIGRPEAHAVLGSLMLEARPKYGLLELKVATTLKPDDWLARRDLFVGLTAMGVDEAARAELETLQRVYAGWQHDTLLTAARAALERRGTTPPVARF